MMDFIRKNYKKIVTFLICIILAELAVTYYMVEQFHETYISKDDACEIALDDAGLKESGVNGLAAKFRHKDGRGWYEVGFEQAAPPYRAYTFEIDAETGTIISRSSEEEPGS